MLQSYHMEHHLSQKFIFIFIMNGRDFITNGRGFITNRQDFHDERLRFSWWTVEIFMIACRDFMINGLEIFMMVDRDFLDKRSRFSWWTVEIFMMNGPDFHGEQSRFSRWVVEIFMMTAPELLIALAKMPERERSTSPSSFYGQLPDY